MFTQRLKLFLPEEHDENIKYIDEFIAAVKSNPGSVDEVWLTTSYGYPKLERHKEIADYQKIVADRFREGGIRVSMQIANTIGHGSTAAGRDCSGLVYDGSEAETLIGPDGVESKYCFCWNGKVFAEYYKKVMGYYSVVKPYRVWVDDDLRARNHKPVEYGCFCDRCIANFNAKHGYSFDRAALVTAINRDGTEVRRNWTEFVREGLYNFTFSIVSEFVKHAPDSLFAFQYGANGHYTGYGIDFLLEPMYKITGKTLGYRGGGSAYGDNNPSEFITKARGIEYQHSILPDYVDDLRPEIECIPDVAYGKSTNGIVFEADTYFAYGATSMSFAMLRRPYESLRYHATEFAKIASHRPYLERLSEYNKRTSVSGIEFMISKNVYLRHQKDDEPDFSYVDRQSYIGGLEPVIGMPLAYKSGDRTKVYQLTENAAVSLSDEDIKELLKKPVITDGKCISMLMERGYDDFGIEIHPVSTIVLHEHFLPCEINKTLWGERWEQNYYDHEGYAFFAKNDKVIPLSEYIGATPVIKAIFPERAEHKFGLSAVIVTTSGGGKWAIFGNNPWTYKISFDRRNQILGAIDYISDKKAVKAILADPLKAIVRPRVTEENKIACVSLVNTTVGDSGELTLIIRDPESECFDFMCSDTLIEDLYFEKKNGEYYVKVPSMKGWSVATVFCK